MSFNERDFRVEWYSGTGCGGQHRNKHQNSCRITHIPTGMVATAQCRSRETSLLQAKQAILQKVNGHQQEAFSSSESADRKAQVGSGERGDKIRTYRFQDNITKDHRTGKTAPTGRVMDGHFDALW